MKVRRYFAANMRSALEMIRQEQGPDVLILSNRKVENGVELVTADGEIDDQLVQKFADQAKADVAARTSTKVSEAREEVPPNEQIQPQTSKPVPAAQLESVDGATLWTDSSTAAAMQRELSGIKGLLEQQLSGLAWSDFGSKHPTRARLLRVLARAGIAPALGRALTAALPDDVPFEDGWKFTLRVLESRLKVLDDPILKAGGRIILCGPTGVGKTLLACKLAAHFALVNGAEKVALVSTDDQRLGAQQQLNVFGSLLGIAVHSAHDREDLSACLKLLDDKELVLIDTAGAPADDAFLREMVNMLALEDRPVESYLVLSASTDYLSLNKILAATTDLALRGCMLTKLDEAAVLGPAISAVVEAGLPIAYLSAGQNVPDDLEAPLARHLVDKTIALGGATPLQDDPTAIERAFMTDCLQTA